MFRPLLQIILECQQGGWHTYLYGKLWEIWETAVVPLVYFCKGAKECFSSRWVSNPFNNDYFGWINDSYMTIPNSVWNKHNSLVFCFIHYSFSPSWMKGLSAVKAGRLPCSVAGWSTREGFSSSCGIYSVHGNPYGTSREITLTSPVRITDRPASLPNIQTKHVSNVWSGKGLLLCIPRCIWIHVHALSRKLMWGTIVLKWTLRMGYRCVRSNWFGYKFLVVAGIETYREGNRKRFLHISLYLPTKFASY